MASTCSPPLLPDYVFRLMFASISSIFCLPLCLDAIYLHRIHFLLSFSLDSSCSLIDVLSWYHCLFGFAFKCYFLSDRCAFVASTFCCLQYRMLLLGVSVPAWYPIFCMPLLLESNVKVVEIWPIMNGCVYVYTCYICMVMLLTRRVIYCISSADYLDSFLKMFEFSGKFRIEPNRRKT